MRPYPPAERADIVETLHGRRVADPYRWLEAADGEATESWLGAQEELFTAQRRRWSAVEALRLRLTDLLGAGYVSPPAWRGARHFLLRRTATQEHATLHTADADGTDRVLVDPQAIDPAGTTTLDAWQPSKEGDLLAYQLSHGGTEESLLRVIDVATGDVVDGPIDRVRYSPVSWLPGGEAFYYVRRLPPGDVPAGEEQFHRRVWLHRVGTSTNTDVEVFGADLDPTTFFGVSVSRDGRWLVVSASVGTAPRNDVWLADLGSGPASQPNLRPVQVGVDAQTHLRPGRDGRLYIWSDLDEPRGRLWVADPTRPAAEDWRPLVGPDPEAVLEAFAILDTVDPPALVCAWTRHAVSELTVHDLATGERSAQVALPGLGSVGGLVERPEGGSECWFGYSDHATPPSVWRYDGNSGRAELWASPPGLVADAPTPQVRQVTYPSTDRTPVRMFVVSRDDLDAGPRPTILYGYGGFGVPLSPAYSAGLLAWVEAGGAYAVANIRGGGEEGESWHRAGMGAGRQQVVEDFLAAAEWLCDRGWSSSAQLAISGGSNGGLLVGAALTQRPDLFRAVVCAAPLLDMLRYPLTGFGRLWTEEYGDPADPEAAGWLAGFSPYHRVRPNTAYPAVLFTVFESDTRVDPAHARKMCAALQHATTAPKPQRPILIRVEQKVGHAGRSLSRTIDLTADTLAFCAWATGLSVGSE